jgi:hypothetical protein
MIESGVHERVQLLVRHQREYQLTRLLLNSQDLQIADIVGRLANGAHQGQRSRRGHTAREQDLTKRPEGRAVLGEILVQRRFCFEHIGVERPVEAIDEIRNRDWVDQLSSECP